MSNDYNMLSEAYSRIYLKEDNEFRDQMPSSKEEYDLGVDPDEVKELETALSTHIEQRLNDLTKKVASEPESFLKVELGQFIRTNPKGLDASINDLLDHLLKS